MLTFIDNFLNRITMYRLVLYYLIGLVGISIIFSFFKILPYDPFLIAATLTFMLAVSYVTNVIFSKVFDAPTNVESIYITSLILALIIAPSALTIHNLIFLGFAGMLSESSKYILAIGKKHIFNPVGVAIVLTSFGFQKSANWWTGNVPMMPFIFLGGILIVRKIQKTELILSFLVSALGMIIFFTILRSQNIVTSLNAFFLHSSLFFFAFAMLTEPLTTPPTVILQVLYGLIVGVLFVPQIHFMGIYSTPELALIIGNIFSYLVSPKTKLILNLKEKLKIGDNLFDFIFPLSKKMAFIPGQYMEWTLPHNNIDSRGNRRYFTIASSPTEDNLRLGVKFVEKGSSYKKSMLKMTGFRKDKIVASQLAGEFTLPKNKNEKCVFVAGGIGITPFRSMIKFLIDKNEKRDIVLIYSNKHESEIVYKDVFDEAKDKLGIKIIYVLTDKTQIPENWQGVVGRLNADILVREIPDYKSRKFYISGSHSLVEGFKNFLKSTGIADSQIQTDFFPGFV